MEDVILEFLIYFHVLTSPLIYKYVSLYYKSINITHFWNYNITKIYFVYTFDLLYSNTLVTMEHNHKCLFLKS
jgi:hypothetical protein